MNNFVHDSDAVSKSYRIQASLCYSNASTPVYKQLEIQLPKDKFTCLLGESGCGKTSLLRQIAGFKEDSSISEFIVTNGDDFENAVDVSTKVAYMAQQDLLMPWMNILDNILLGNDLSRPLLQKKTSAQYEKREQVLLLLEKLGMADFAYHKPNQLSGGMRQRVALARTLMQDKPIVLMDEPFAALDALNRYKLQDLAANMLAEKCVVLVTHDAQEALRLGEQILLFPSVVKKSNTEKQEFQFITPDFPSASIPRAINAELGRYQAQLLQNMGALSC